MNRTIPFLVPLLLLAGCATDPALPAADRAYVQDASFRARAERIMRDTPLVDGHNDTPWQYRKRVDNRIADLDLAADLSDLESPMHTDLPRLRAGRVGGQFWSVYIPIRRFGGDPGDARTVFEQIDLVRRLAATYPDLEMAYTADDVERIHAAGRIASLIGMEGGHSIENSLAVLRETYRAGARYMTITHSISTTWADSATDETRVPEGLTAFGREVVREMNRLGMMVDLSHVSPATMHAALDIAEAPVIFSHSSARALCDHPRNVPDDVLERVAENDGVVMVTFVPTYLSETLRTHVERRAEVRRELAAEHVDDLDAIRSGMDAWNRANPAPRCTLADVADHIEHVARVAGVAHVGIGSDYDGIGALPVGLEDVSTYPDLVAELLRRGFTGDEVRMIIGGNVLRVMRDVEAAAVRLRARRPPSEATIEKLDGDAGE